MFSFRFFQKYSLNSYSSLSKCRVLIPFVFRNKALQEKLAIFKKYEAFLLKIIENLPASMQHGNESFHIWFPIPESRKYIVKKERQAVIFEWFRDTFFPLGKFPKLTKHNFQTSEKLDKIKRLENFCPKIDYGSWLYIERHFTFAWFKKFH